MSCIEKTIEKLQRNPDLAAAVKFTNGWMTHEEWRGLAELHQEHDEFFDDKAEIDRLQAEASALRETLKDCVTLLMPEAERYAQEVPGEEGIYEEFHRVIDRADAALAMGEEETK